MSCSTAGDSGGGGGGAGDGVGMDVKPVPLLMPAVVVLLAPAFRSMNWPAAAPSAGAL